MGNKATRNETGIIRDTRTMNIDSIGFNEEGSSVDAISTVDLDVPSMSGLPGEVLVTQGRGNSDKNLNQSFASSVTEIYTSTPKILETASNGDVSCHSADSRSTHKDISKLLNKQQQHASLNHREISQNEATRNFGGHSEAGQVNPFNVIWKKQLQNDQVKEKSKPNIHKQSVGFGSMSSDYNEDILISYTNPVNEDDKHITEGVGITTNEAKMSNRLNRDRDYVRKHSQDSSELPEVEIDSLVQSESVESMGVHSVTKVSLENTEHDFTKDLRSKATDKTVDNRIIIMDGNMVDDGKPVRKVIYSNIMFFPDKSKGATPKRYGPRYLGSGPKEALSTSVKSSSSESDVEMSEKNVKISLEQSDPTNESVHENISDIANVDLDSTPQNTSQAAIRQGIQQKQLENCLPADCDHSLLFFDNHFGLNTGDCASGFSSKFLDYNLYPNKISDSEIDKEQPGPDSTIEYVGRTEDSSSNQSITWISEKEEPVTDVVSFKENTIPWESMSTRQNRSFNACENQSRQKGYNKRSSLDDLLVLMDTERLTHLRKKATTPDSKNCFAALIDWHKLESRQGCFAKNLKSVCTNICEDNRLCFEFGFKPCNGYVVENVVNDDSFGATSNVLHRCLSSDSSDEFLENDLDDSSSESDSFHEEDKTSDKVNKEVTSDKQTRVIEIESHGPYQKIVPSLIPNGHVAQDICLIHDSPLNVDENMPLNDGQDSEVVSKKQNIESPEQNKQLTNKDKEYLNGDFVCEFTHSSVNSESHKAETSNKETEITVKADSIVMKGVSLTSPEGKSLNENLKILSEAQCDIVSNAQYNLIKKEQTEKCMDKDKENAEVHNEFMRQDKDKIKTLSELDVKNCDERSCRHSMISAVPDDTDIGVDTEHDNVFEFTQGNIIDSERRSSLGIITVTKHCSKVLEDTGADHQSCDSLVTRNQGKNETKSSRNVNMNVTPDEEIKSSDKGYLSVFTLGDKYKRKKTSPKDDNRLVVIEDESEKEGDDIPDAEKSDVSPEVSPVKHDESSIEPGDAALLPVLALLSQLGIDIPNMENSDIETLLELGKEGLTSLEKLDVSRGWSLRSQVVNTMNTLGVDISEEDFPEDEMQELMTKMGLPFNYSASVLDKTNVNTCLEIFKRLTKIRKEAQEETIPAMSSSELSASSSNEESLSEVLPSGVFRMDAGSWDDVINGEKQRCELHMINTAKEDNRCTVVCIDISASMSGENWHIIKNMLTQFVNGLEDVRQRHFLKEYVSLVVFGEETRIAVLPTTQYAELPETFDRLESKGASPLLQGLRLSSSVLEEMKYRGKHLHGIRMAPRIILMSDGRPTPADVVGDMDILPQKFHIEAVNECLEKLPDIKWPIIFIPVGPNTDPDFFSAISEKENCKTVSAEEMTQLVNSTHNYYRAAQIARPFLMAEKDNMDLGVVRSLARTLHPECSETDVTEITDIVVKAHKKAMKKKTKKKKETFSGSSEDEDENTDESDEDSNDDDSHQLQENLPPLGTRVVKGPDACGIFEHVSKCGTVTGHSKKKSRSLFIHWDSDLSTYAKYGADDKYEVVIEDSARPSRPEGPISVGCKVRRGPDWQYGDQDGGSDQLGVVYSVLTGNRVAVHWPNKYQDVYRYDKDGVYDVVISDPRDPFGMETFVSDMNKKNTALSESRDPLDDVDDEADVSDEKNKNA